ncbi:molybdopterin-dependent oxidoreductase [Maricurvus nonylphenolicus]|uniref:molybdopterin-containing oxidoreductase family protein n=1 Tax=Maricurvus nonylphenolicus TaxID=1008307 RepID=UPI0036F20385
MTVSETKKTNAVCASCDIGCPLVVESKDGEVVKIGTHDKAPIKDYICMKGANAHVGFTSEHRITKPLKRVGERGGDSWEEISWEQAMTEIAEKLSQVVDKHGPESLAVATSQWNTSNDNGMGRRFMNLLGSPNWISGVALCAGNTAAVNRMTYGWFPYADFKNTKCVVLFGHNPRKHSWTPIYHKVRAAQKEGAKLIVVDPRRSSNADLADVWLPIKPGTDAALCLGWLNVIIEEELYDKDFVRDWTVGFDELKARVAEYPLSRVAEITGVDEELIREAARVYAEAESACIPWTPITDQQRNSTSAIRLQCILRALTGNVDSKGGDILHGLNQDIMLEDDLELHHMLPQQQKDKQLGADKHPVFTYRGMEALKEPAKRVWGREYVNLLTGCFMAVPYSTFRAMAGQGPYPVKAFISLGNNSLMGYSNMKLIYDGMMNQDLVVVHEHIMTPTAQLADYVLPGDSWVERNTFYDSLGWVSAIMMSNKAIEPPGECRSVFDFWCDLGRRMGFEEYFPWQSVEELYDLRLEKLGISFEEFSRTKAMNAPKLAYKKYEQTGFATPSGKVELESSILADLGFDPLPYYIEAPQPDADYPLMMFTGVREDEFFQTGQRHIPVLRNRNPEPKIFLHPQDAEALGVEDNEWVYVENPAGKVKGLMAIRENMPAGVVRVPHGWWRPETQQGKEHLSSAWEISDAQLTIDDVAFIDPEQGIPHLRGMPCKVYKV